MIFLHKDLKYNKPFCISRIIFQINLNLFVRFKASLENAGRYTCTAQNKYASVNETTMVDVYGKS